MMFFENSKELLWFRVRARRSIKADVAGEEREKQGERIPMNESATACLGDKSQTFVEVDIGWLCNVNANTMPGRHGKQSCPSKCLYFGVVRISDVKIRGDLYV